MTAASSDTKPTGRDAVMTALIEATTILIVEEGLSMSVRDIAARAGVNHGLVHTYFGTKEDLLRAAFDDIAERVANELDEDGFPSLDLASRRGGELAKALARVMLEAPADPFTTHEVMASWRKALAAQQPELSDAEVTARVIAAASMSLGYALFADHFAAAGEMDAQQQAHVSECVVSLAIEIGGIPERERHPEP